MVADTHVRVGLLASHAETDRTTIEALLLVVAHTVATDLRGIADKVTLELFEGLFERMQVIKVEVDISFASIEQSGHRGGAKIGCTCKPSQSGRFVSFLKQHGHSEVPKDHLSLSRTIQYVFWLDVPMHNSHRVHHHQLLHECFFTLLQIKAFLNILEIVGDRLTQFHFELYAVIEAYQVVASVDYLGAYVQQGKYFVVAKLFKTFFEL